MSFTPQETRPWRFSSETLTGLVVFGISFVIAIPCAWVVVRVILDVRSGLRDRRTLKKKKKKGGASEDGDVEAQAGNKTDLELGGDEKNGGLCELEQPGLPELSAIGLVEMWEEGCAREIDGEMVPAEMDACETAGLKLDVECDRNGSGDMERRSSLADEQLEPGSSKQEATE